MVSKQDVVGPGNYGAKPTATPTPTATPSPLPSIVPTPSATQNNTTTRIDSKLGDKGISLGSTADTEGLSLINSLSNEQISLLGAILKQRNYTVKASAQYMRNLFSTEPELATIAGKAGSDFNTLVSLLSEDLLPSLMKQPSAGPKNLPSRQIYEYRDEDIDAIVNGVYESTVARKPTPAELLKQRTEARAKLEMGTLSTTKEARNPKTGKMETVTTQTPGSSTEEIKTDIESELAKLNPDEVDRKKRIDFSSWLSQNAAGA